MTDSNQNRTWMTEYDLTERPMRIIGREGNNHLYTAEVTYDGYSHPSGMKEQVGTARTKYNTSIAYDTADRVTGISSTNGSVGYTYDGIGRIATKSITAGLYTDTCTYSYQAGGYGTGSTTGLITSQSQGNVKKCLTFAEMKAVRTLATSWIGLRASSAAPTARRQPISTMQQVS